VTADEVLDVLDRLTAAGAEVWVDGGWAVDALLGEQSRPHSDLDLTVPVAGLDAALARLAADGFDVLRDERPTSIAVRHADGREVDLHPVEPTGDGGGEQILPDGSRWRYEAPAWGTIGGRRVPCLALDTQVRAHLGFDPRPEQRDDMRRLQERFGIDLPAPYDAG
jgi:lincosamide nucleotidyltransferase A/C/D/E